MHLCRQSFNWDGAFALPGCGFLSCVSVTPQRSNCDQVSLIVRHWEWHNAKPASLVWKCRPFSIFLDCCFDCFCHLSTSFPFSRDPSAYLLERELLLLPSQSSHRFLALLFADSCGGNWPAVNSQQESFLFFATHYPEKDFSLEGR